MPGVVLIPESIFFFLVVVVVFSPLLIVAPKFENRRFRAKLFQWDQNVRMCRSHRLGNMVAVMANEQQQFESLVSQLMSPDNNIRNQAEVGKCSFILILLFCFCSNPRSNVHGLCRPSLSRRTLHRLGSNAMCNLHPRNCSCYLQWFATHTNSWIFLCVPLLQWCHFIKEQGYLMVLFPRFSVIIF